jgi:hypothetical protein
MPGEPFDLDGRVCPVRVHIGLNCHWLKLRMEDLAERGRCPVVSVTGGVCEGHYGRSLPAACLRVENHVPRVFTTKSIRQSLLGFHILRSVCDMRSSRRR